MKNFQLVSVARKSKQWVQKETVKKIITKMKNRMDKTWDPWRVPYNTIYYSTRGLSCHRNEQNTHPFWVLQFSRWYGVERRSYSHRLQYWSIRSPTRCTSPPPRLSFPEPVECAAWDHQDRPPWNCNPQLGWWYSIALTASALNELTCTPPTGTKTGWLFGSSGTSSQLATCAQNKASHVLRSIWS